MRGLITYLFFFTCGLVAAGAYFYQLHPEHSIENDLPRMRRAVDDAIERGRRVQEAWEEAEPSQEPAEAGSTP
jgi:hypothetical protein